MHPVFSIVDMKTKVVSLFALILLYVIAPQVAGKQKHALVVGVGRQLDKSWSQLHVDKDVECVREMLGDHGFSDVTILRDEAATKSAIVSSMQALSGRCGKGDVVYVHFSGHGQQMTDLDGDETDTLDESWIPYDAYMAFGPEDDGSRHLGDDQLHLLLAGISAAVGEEGAVIVVVDACHSGGSTRDAVQSGTSTRDALREEDTGECIRGTDRPFVLPGVCDSVCNPSEGRPRWLIISACEDYQVNWEMKNPKMGKLTWCLHKLGSRLGQLSDQQVLDEVTALMSTPQTISPLPQNPRMEGGDGSFFRKLFGNL